MRPFYSLVISIACTFMLLSCTSSPAVSTQELALERTQNGLYATEVSIEGRGPVKMVLDTAAQTSSIRQSALTWFDIGERSQKNWIVHGLLESQQAPSVAFESFTAGDFATSGDFVVLTDEDSLNDPAIQGLLGADFLASNAPSNRYLLIDLRDNKVATSPSLTALGVPASLEWSPLKEVGADRGFFAIAVDAHGVDALAIIDTGLQFSVINEAFATQLATRGRHRESLYMKDVTGGEVQLDVVRMGPLRGAKTHWSPVKTLIYDSPALDLLAPGDRPAMMLGVSHLKNMSILIDRQEQKIALGLGGDLRSRSMDCGIYRAGCADSLKVMQFD